MIQKHVPSRVITLVQQSKPYLKAAGILVAFAVLYLTPTILTNIFGAASFSAWLAGYEGVSDGLDIGTGLIDTLSPVWRVAVVGFFAYRYARVHELIWHRWMELRAVMVATLALFVVPGLWQVFSSATSGEYATLDSPPESDPSVGAAVISDFTGFSSGLFVFLSVAILVYFYLAFDPESLAGYGDVLVSTVGMVVFIELYHNFFDALEERLLWNSEFASPVDGLLSATFSDPFGYAIFVLYYGVIVIAFLWLIEYLGGGIDHEDTSEPWV